MAAKNARTPEKNGGSKPIKGKRENYDHDGLWKDLIERFFYSLLKRALPELYEAADTGRKPDFLDKEFRDILNTADPEIHNSPHFADYVAKVPLKNGKTEWVLLHMEFQSKDGKNFAARMYHYKSLIFAHYKAEPVALAVITDRRPRGGPPCYSHSAFGTKTTYVYNVLVLAELDDSELAASGNPVDLALYAAKCALSVKEEHQKYSYLRTLTGLLAERGWGMDDKRDLLLFLERIMALKDKGLRLQYREYQEHLDREGKIVYVTVAEEYYTAKGIEKGRAEGIEKGKAEARMEMARNFLANGVSPDIIVKSTGLPLDQIRGLMN